VNFPAEDDGKTVLCRISYEALQNHFGLQGIDGQAAKTVFEQNRARIVSAAARKYAAGRGESDGSILIRTADDQI
jgi:hypothetical protein